MPSDDKPLPHEKVRAPGAVIRDFVLFVGKIAGGLAFVAAVIIVFVNCVPERYWIGERWVGLVIATPVIFGFVLRVCKRFLRRSLLWIAVVAVFLAHLIFWNVLLKRWETFNPAWFAFVLAPEFMVIGYILVWCEVATDGFKRLPRFTLFRRNGSESE